MTDDHRGLKTSNDVNYQIWMDLFEKDIYAPCDCPETNGTEPELTLILPLENSAEGLEAAAAGIAAAEEQTDRSFELLVVSSGDDRAAGQLKERFSGDRLRYLSCPEGGRAALINRGIQEAVGRFFAVLEPGDLLAPHAVREIRRKMRENRGYAFVYSDEDRLSRDESNRYRPFFKPDWSPDTLLSFDYTGRLSVFDTELARKIGGVNTGFPGAEIYELTLRLTEEIEADRIGHISSVLCHVFDRFAPLPSQEAGDPAAEAKRRAKTAVLAGRGKKIRTELVEDAGQYNVVYEVEGEPLVSIIIPSKDNLAYLKPCLESIFRKSSYSNYEIVLVDNGSRVETKEEIDRYIQDKPVRYIYQPMIFNFSRMCNIGASHAKGEYLLFLNDDISILQKDWIERMLGQAQQAHAGAVGAKLVYPRSNQIQHTGVLNMKDGPAHALVLFSDGAQYAFGRNVLCYNYLAVTAACLMTAADKFHAVGGFNEDMTVAYNDTDLCFSLYEKGWYNVVRPDVKLIHYESVSRGYDVNDMTKFFRMNQERCLLNRRHPSLVERDPFFNRNYSDYLVDFSLMIHDPEKPYLEARTLDGAPGEMRTFNIAIDSLDMGQTCIVSGWTSTGDFELDEKGKFYLLLELAGGHVTAVPVHKFRRERIPGAVSTNVGFIARFDASVLIRRRARIGMACVLGDTKFHCWTDRLAQWDSFNYFRRMKAEDDALDHIPEEPVQYSLDRCVMEGGALMMRGWAFTAGRLYNNEIALRIYIKDPSGLSYCNVNRQVRFDVCRLYNKEMNLLYSGFEADCALAGDWKKSETELWLVARNLRNGKVWKQRVETEVE